MEKLKSHSLENENWIYVMGSNEKYAVSDKGRLASFWKANPIIIRPHPCKNGYLKAIFTLPEGVKTIMPHRIVAKHFCNNPDNKLEVNHINGIKTDNQATNLEWVTRTENVRHSVVAGLHKGFVKGHVVVNRVKGSAVHTSVLNETLVRQIRSDIKTGMKYREAAEKYKVKMSTISSALTYWKHIK